MLCKKRGAIPHQLWAEWWAICIVATEYWLWERKRGKIDGVKWKNMYMKHAVISNYGPRWKLPDTSFLFSLPCVCWVLECSYVFGCVWKYTFWTMHGAKKRNTSPKWKQRTREQVESYWGVMGLDSPGVHSQLQRNSPQRKASEGLWFWGWKCGSD